MFPSSELTSCLTFTPQLANTFRTLLRPLADTEPVQPSGGFTPPTVSFMQHLRYFQRNGEGTVQLARKAPTEAATRRNRSQELAWSQFLILVMPQLCVRCVGGGNKGRQMYLPASGRNYEEDEQRGVCSDVFYEQPSVHRSSGAVSSPSPPRHV